MEHCKTVTKSKVTVLGERDAERMYGDIVSDTRLVQST